MTQIATEKSATEDTEDTSGDDGLRRRRRSGRSWISQLSVSFVFSVAVAFVPSVARAQETIGEIRVHGNHTTPDADIIGLSGLKPGDPATDTRLAQAERMLSESRRFENVEIRKRFRSIDDPADILVMIVVDERAGVSADDLTPGIGTRLRSAILFWPILNYADGYGFTYGLRPAFADPIGSDSLLSFPLSWGGERRAAVALERSFDDQRTRAGVAVSVNRRVNPFFDAADLRQQVRLEADHALLPWMRVGASARIAHVEFGDGYEARHVAAGPNATFDTRIDPLFPRNAVHARIDWQRLTFETGSAGVFDTDARVYIGLVTRAVLALRGQFVRSDGPLPEAEQSLLGGYDSLRGHRPGHRAGDSLAAVSAEVRLPLTSPVQTSQFGVKGFIDAGTVWNAGTRLADHPFERGIGGGVFLGAAVIRLDLDVAWPEDGKPRLHFAMGVNF